MAIAQINRLALWVLRHTSDGFYVRFMHYLPLLKGRWPGILHIRRPRTLTEKIQYLKINIEQLIPDAHIYADKLAVRDYVADTIGEQHLIRLLGSWERAEHIDWPALPDQFVIKANHGAAFNIIVNDKTKLDTAAATTQLNEWLAIDYSQRGRENHYRNIPPRLLAEALLDSGYESPPEYKFRCFDGKCEIVTVTIDRYTDPKRLIVDTAWNRLPVELDYPQPAREIEKPAVLDSMVSIAETLAAPFFYVRVDLYEVEGSIYFSELTFTPLGGTVPFSPPEWNRKLGDLLHLPQ